MVDRGVEAGQLRSIVERIERQEQEKKEISEDIREIYAEAKANGFDVKALRQILRIRKCEPEAMSEAAAMVDLYASALGMQGDLFRG